MGLWPHNRASYIGSFLYFQIQLYRDPGAPWKEFKQIVEKMDTEHVFYRFDSGDLQAVIEMSSLTDIEMIRKYFLCYPIINKWIHMIVGLPDESIFEELTSDYWALSPMEKER